MKKPWLALLSGGLVTLPALLFLGFILSGSRHEYYFPAHAAMAIFFCMASPVSGAAIAHQFAGKIPQPRLALYFFIGLAAAWMASLAILALLNLTPLCVGQDNGDGSNDASLCLVYAALVSAAYSPPVLLLAGLAAQMVSRLVPRPFYLDRFGRDGAPSPSLARGWRTPSWGLAFRQPPKRKPEKIRLSNHCGQGTRTKREKRQHLMVNEVLYYFKHLIFIDMF